MMKPVIHHFHSPDVDDLADPALSGSADVGILVQIVVSPEGVPEGETFDVVVCTPAWLTRQLRSLGRPLDGRHHLLVETFDWEIVHAHLTEQVLACEGRTWTELGTRIGRIGRWEFEDYREAGD